MLDVICGNKTVQKILIFLFVNGKCYGTQLHRCLQTPLTPLQKSLARLEKGELIVSYYEGKTRLYQFNSAFPLLSELEHLLKKAYTLLPTEEKKRYYVVQKERALSHPPDRCKIVLSFWERLNSIERLTFQAKTKSKDVEGWHGKGNGEVIIQKLGDNVLIFSEKGSWQGKNTEEFGFSNVFRWTIDRHLGVLSLEHLRRGAEQPVFLFYLTPATDQSLVSVDSHLCGGDTYFGQLHLDRYGLRLNWRVIGPKKNEEMDYYYIDSRL